MFKKYIFHERIFSTGYECATRLLESYTLTCMANVIQIQYMPIIDSFTPFTSSDGQISFWSKGPHWRELNNVIILWIYQLIAHCMVYYYRILPDVHHLWLIYQYFALNAIILPFHCAWYTVTVYHSVYYTWLTRLYSTVNVLPFHSARHLAWYAITVYHSVYYTRLNCLHSALNIL